MLNLEGVYNQTWHWRIFRGHNQIPVDKLVGNILGGQHLQYVLLIPGKLHVCLVSVSMFVAMLQFT